MVMRPMAEIEAEVRGALSSLPEVWGCSHVRLLWDAARGGAIVQADLLMDPSMRVRQATRPIVHRMVHCTVHYTVHRWCIA